MPCSPAPRHLATPSSLAGAGVSGPAAGGTHLARLGLFLQRHQRGLQRLQWLIVLFYLALVVLPAFMPPPAENAHLWNNLRLLAQFLFWGLWWPGVMLATMLLGRVWCGLLCPEGTLTEWASRHGQGRPVPRWLKWSGWPVVAFISITVYGQLISVYEYPEAALLILGGSTLLALIVGYFYGRGKRIWCRHLCPANGVFGLLARLAPLHYQVERQHWQQPGAAGKTIIPVNCAPLVDIRRMESASECHACGRCAGHRDAVTLAARPPWQEILNPNLRLGNSEALLLIFGLLGVASAAFQWSLNPDFVRLKMWLAGWLIDHDQFLLLQDNAPWWLLTHHPAASDVFTWLDGLMVLGYILGMGALLGALVWCAMRLATRLLNAPRLPWTRLCMALIPLAGCSVVVGLSLLTSTQLRAEGFSPGWLLSARSLFLGLGFAASLWLGLRLIAQQPGTNLRQLAAGAMYLLGTLVIPANWWLALYVW